MGTVYCIAFQVECALHKKKPVLHRLYKLRSEVKTFLVDAKFKPCAVPGRPPVISAVVIPLRHFTFG